MFTTAVLLHLWHMVADGGKLALYRAHAGAPVSSFHYFGRFDSWTDIGDRAVAIWTRPSAGFLA
jgi:hypothetical protein